ncbi:hypothetical protein KIL84_014806 [Mauremys mutica]|uniref:Uncharacterized protein n=1 Tax=Mauremys mutica TaxID=74926 RepID=A0A9D3XRZ5_9SAUR|nr:hypothetical protein KIL84_014806 [Mauremys mutica]
MCLKEGPKYPLPCWGYYSTCLIELWTFSLYSTEISVERNISSDINVIVVKVGGAVSLDRGEGRNELFSQNENAVSKSPCFAFIVQRREEESYQISVAEMHFLCLYFMITAPCIVTISIQTVLC